MRNWQVIFIYVFNLKIYLIFDKLKDDLLYHFFFSYENKIFFFII